MAPETTASTRGRRNRANGQTCERKVAAYLRSWWPDARRAVVNGWATPERRVVDPGDIDGTDATLWWSIKDCVVERYGAWFAEMDTKAGGRIAILVVRRRGHTDVGTWWAWLTVDDFLGLTCASRFIAAPGAHLRLELRTLLDLLADNHCTPDRP